MGFFGSIGRSIEHGISNVWHAATGLPTASEKRDQAKLVKDQIEAYKQQTSMAEEQLNEARASREVEKRKVNEKQIRNLRHNYRPAGGFLNNRGLTAAGGSETGDISNKLGS